MAPSSPASVALSPHATRFCSILVLALHFIYCGSYGYETHQYFTQAQVELQYQTYVYRLLGLGVLTPRAISCTLAATGIVIVVWHATGLVRALRASLRFRRLLLDVPEEKILQRLKTTLGGGLQSKFTEKQPVQDHKPSCFRRWYTTLRNLKRAYMSMDGEHFETGTNIRKSIEIATQIHLLNRMSRTITERGINHLVVAVFTINCWSTALIRWRFRHTHDPLPGRLYRHIVNMVLASVFTVTVPVAIWVFVMPLVSTQALRFDQLATTRVRLLLRHILVSQWTQVLSTRLAACTAILAIETLKHKLIANAPPLSGSTVACGTPASDENEPQQTVSSTLTGTQLQRRRRVAWLNVHTGLLFDLAWVLTGCAVLALHIDAQTERPLASGVRCHMPLWPWSEPRPACAVLELNCHRGHRNGSFQEMDHLLQTIDPSTVSVLRLTHCPALAVPARVQSLDDLAMFEVYNSSLVQWGADAALSSRHHKYLGSLWLNLVTGIAALPPGLLDREFPAADILISRTDLASLPDDLPDRWPRDMSKLVIEHSRLALFPTALQTMSGLATSLAGNALESIPAGAFQGRWYFAFLALSENPRLRHLPDRVSWAASLLDLRGTNVTRVPVPLAGGVVLAGSSPVCTTATQTTGVTIDCRPPLATTGSVDGRVTGLVPIAELAQQRQP